MLSDRLTGSLIDRTQYHQKVPSRVWIIRHRRNKRVELAVFDHNGQPLVPKSIDRVDNDNAHVHFQTPQAGHVKIE